LLWNAAVVIAIGFDDDSLLCDDEDEDDKPFSWNKSTVMMTTSAILCFGMQ
jgi:hypothetical protein